MKNTTLSTVVRAFVLLAVAILAVGGTRTGAQATSQGGSATNAPVVPARITQAINENQLFQAKGSVHGLARPEFDEGAVSDSTPMKRMRLVLKRSPEQQAALRQLMTEQMIAGSPNFHKWLTPQEFGERFGPADADINVITGWLGSKGFTDIHVSPGRLTVEFSGNVGQVRNVFHTEIHRFLIDGEVKQANVSDPQFPAALSPVVRGIATLHNFSPRSMRQTKGLYTQKPDGTIVPQFTFTGGGGTQFFAVGPGDFAKIYNIPAGLDGTGGKIAIIGFSDIDPADVDNFRALFSLPAKNLNIVVNGPDPGFTSEEGEAGLDVQASGAVAQKAQIDYILSETTLTNDPLTLGAQYVIDNNSDDVMSLSFGSCEALIDPNFAQFISDLWEQAAAQGITVVVSSGDNGSAGCDDFNKTQTPATHGISANAFASTLFNVAVGGTDFDDVGTQISGGFWSATNAAGKVSAQGYIHEVPWNDSCAATATSSNVTTCATPDNIVAGSGGSSVLYSRPDFQSGIAPNGILASDAPNHRFIPDVSLFASDGPKSHSFYIQCQADTGATCVTGPNGTPFQGVGGTSASAPSFAGILALIGQSEATAGRSRRLGNANFVLYNLAKTAANSCNSSSTPLAGSATCVFYDVTKGNNSVPCSGGAAANCSATTGGVLVTANPVANTPAFTSTPGYDLATGLGTVNVANLASKWHTATLTGTTTSTRINGAIAPINITHGTLVILSASVTSGGGVPTGDVSFLAPQGTVNGGIGSLTLDGSGNAVGAAPGAVIPGGTYTIKAHYGGDATFAPSDDPTGVPVTVAKENSKLQMGIVTTDLNTGGVVNPSATNFSFGSPYVLRFDILNSAGSTCVSVVPAGQPQGNLINCAFDATGTVTITNNGAPLDQGTFNVNSQGSGEDQPIDLTAGAHTIVGNYSGDTSYNAAGPTTLNLTVTKATTATAIAAKPSTGVTTATPVTLTATISSQSISTTGAGGTVTFSDNGTPIGAPAPVTPASAGATTFAGGTAALTTTFATTGNHVVTAAYSGDTNYANSTSAGTTITVAVANPAPTLTNLSPNTAIAGGAAFTLTLTGTGFVTGATVNFGATAIVTSGGSATQLTATIPAAAIATVQAAIAVTVTNPAGGGTSNSLNFSVTAATGSYTVAGTTPAAITAGSSQNSTITATPTAGGFTGTVAATCTSTTAATSLAAVGITCAPNPLNLTLAGITAQSGTLTIAVAAPSTTLTASNLPWPQTLPNSLGGKSLVIVGAGTGFAALFLLFLPGRKRMRAAMGLGLVCLISLAFGCSGNGNNNGGPVPSLTTLTVDKAKNPSGTQFMFTVAVTGGTTTPTGMVQLFDGGTALGTAVVLDATGHITIGNSLATGGVGTHTISAQYLGDARHKASASGNLMVTETGTTTLTITGTSGTNHPTGAISITVN